MAKKKGTKKKGKYGRRSKLGKKRMEAVRRVAISKLSLFATFILKGGAPPPLESKFIARRIDRYIEAGGRLSLDNAFSLRSRQKSGNAAKQHRRERQIEGALSDIFFDRCWNGLSLEDALSKFLNTRNKEPSLTDEVLKKEAASPRGKKMYGLIKFTVGLSRKRG